MSRMRASAEWRFLGVLPKADPVLAVLWWGLIVVRGALPAGFAIATGALVGAVQGRRSLAGPLVAVGVIFVALNALGPVHDAVSGNLGARVGAWLRERLLMAATGPRGLAHLEDTSLANDLGQARQFDLGISMPSLNTAMPMIAMGFAQVAGGLAQAILLAGYKWWAPLAVGGAWVSTHVLLNESAMWKIFNTEAVVAEQRHADYAYRLAVEAPAAKEIRLFGLAGWTVKRFAERKRKLVETMFRERNLMQRPIGWTLALIVGTNALVFWSLARDATAGRLTLASLVVFAQAAVGTSLLAFGEFDWWFRGSARPVPEVLDLAEGMRAVGALSGGVAPADGLPQRDIRFEHVDFTYPSGGRRVLDGFDLTIEAGRSLAIVGNNGAGKTTLAKLLCRLYDPQDGAVRADGTDLRDVDVDSWRSRIAAVFQDYVRYELPLRVNVAPGGSSDADVAAALEAAGASDLAALDTILSRAYAGGTDLSGGQWQRVALARALCSVRTGAGVVILDEPTAQLDVRGEAEIFDRILEATRGLTTILISHRFSTVRHADRICVLENGRVVELGSHDELMALNGRYRTMFDLQASRFYVEEQEQLDTAPAS